MLRAATEPDAEQDQGMWIPEEVVAVIDLLVSGLHDFSWAVLPHVGHFLESDVPIAAYIYNSPLHRTLPSSQVPPLKFKVPLTCFKQFGLSPTV